MWVLSKVCMRIIKKVVKIDCEAKYWMRIIKKVVKIKCEDCEAKYWMRIIKKIMWTLKQGKMGCVIFI